MKHQNLKQWRLDKRLSQTELAEESKVSRASIARYESEGLGSANIHTVNEILLALEIDFDQLELELNKEEK